MDLRYEFEQILLEYGYPTLVIRQEKKLRCSCWDEKRQEADRNCPICFGLGWAPIVEKHTTRESDTSIPETMALIARDGKFGGMAVPGRQYYFRHNTQFVPGDLIVEVTWTPQGKPVYTDGGIYEVSHVDAARYKEGQVIYKKVYCKDTPIEKGIRGIRIANVNGITNYEIAMEG